MIFHYIFFTLLCFCYKGCLPPILTRCTLSPIAISPLRSRFFFLFILQVVSFRMVHWLCKGLQKNSLPPKNVVCVQPYLTSIILKHMYCRTIAEFLPQIQNYSLQMLFTGLVPEQNDFTANVWFWDKRLWNFSLTWFYMENWNFVACFNGF